MNRATRRSLMHLALWGTALSVILYFNKSHPADKVLPWTKVRYISSTDDLPKSRGICPGLETTNKPALVVARVEADGSSSWLDPLVGQYHLCVYTADAAQDPQSTYLQVPANRGHEAMSYLTFIIDNYDHIPEAGTVFVHGSRFAWHNDHPEYDNLVLLKSLDISAALEPYGYHNMRCDWSAGTCNPDTTPQGSFETILRSHIEPFNARVVSDRALPQALKSLFGGDKSSSLGRSDVIHAQCCAQFVVARERIWQHSREEYIAVRQWLLDAKKGSRNSAPRDDRIAGRILSYVWHILFMHHEDFRGDNSFDVRGGINLRRLNEMACPRADDCYCRLYGRCGLQGCKTSGHCRGQYRLPSNYKLPADWAAAHS